MKDFDWAWIYERPTGSGFNFRFGFDWYKSVVTGYRSASIFLGFWILTFAWEGEPAPIQKNVYLKYLKPQGEDYCA